MSMKMKGYHEIEDSATQAARAALDAAVEDIEAEDLDVEEFDEKITDAANDAAAAATPEGVTGFWDLVDPIEFYADRRWDVAGVVVAVAGEEVYRDREAAAETVLAAAAAALGVAVPAVESADDVQDILDDPAGFIG